MYGGFVVFIGFHSVAIYDCNYLLYFLVFLKAVCHVFDWPLQSELNTTDFFVNLCI